MRSRRSLKVSHTQTSVPSGTLNKEVENIRSEKIKGSIVRSRAKWLGERENPSKFFCMVENHRYIDKSSKNIKNEKGENINKQESILIEIHKFYSKLFIKTENTCKKDLFQQIIYSDSQSDNQLSKQDADTLEGELTEHEISQSLQSMKHNKSPVIDGSF